MMAKDSSDILCGDISIIFVHVLSIAYFGLLAANFLCGFLSLPLAQAQGELPDDLVVLIFLFTVIAFSFLCLRSRIARRPSDLEQACVIVLIAVSTIAFVHFQFYYEKWSRRFYLVMFGLSALQSVSRCLRFNAYFPDLCLGYGMLSLIPAIHAILWPSACRLPMTLHFVTFSAFNAISGLNFVLRVPERLGGFKSHPISSFITHTCLIMAAVFMSQRLLAAKASDAILLADECKRLTW